MPDGFYISERFFPIATGADFEQRLEETMLDTEIPELNDDEVSTVRCVVETSRFSLSSANGNAALAEEMFHLTNTDAQHEEMVLHEVDETQQIRFTYAMPAQTYHFLHRTLPDVEMHLSICELHQEHSLENGIFAKADNNAVSLLAYRNGKLQLCNRIEAQGESNQCYFIMTAWNQLGFDALTDTLQLDCNNEKLRQTLNTYIKCVL